MCDEQQPSSAYSQTSEMVIGNTTYLITTFFKENVGETVEQKLVRYVADRIACAVTKSDIGAIAAQT
jgi:hypothetical protein